MKNSLLYTFILLDKRRRSTRRRYQLKTIAEKNEDVTDRFSRIWLKYVNELASNWGKRIGHLGGIGLTAPKNSKCF